MVLVRFQRDDDGTVAVDLSGPYYVNDEQRKAIYAFLDRVAGPESERVPVHVPEREIGDTTGREVRPWVAKDYRNLFRGLPPNELQQVLGRSEMSVRMQLGKHFQPWYHWARRRGIVGEPTEQDVLLFFKETGREM